MDRHGQILYSSLQQGIPKWVALVTVELCSRVQYNVRTSDVIISRVLAPEQISLGVKNKPRRYMQEPSAPTSVFSNHFSFVTSLLDRFASLDLGLLATSFCLLRLPKMPELRTVLQKHKGRLPHFTPAGPEVDIFAIPYKDKAREKARQRRLQQELAAGGKSAKLIKAEKRKAEKERKQKERRQLVVDKGRNPDKKRGRQAQIVDEWDDLAKEERLHKQLKKGKISQEEYDKLLNEV